MSRGKKDPVALISLGLLALGLTIGVPGFIGLTARAHALAQPGQFPVPEPPPSPPFDAGPLPAPVDAAPYDAGLSPYDAGR